MRSIATLTLMAASALAAAAAPTLADEPKGDLARLQGSWTSKVGPNKDIPITVVIKGNAIELIVTRPDGEEARLKGEIKLDEKASPKTLDWMKFTDSEGQDHPDNLGIYKFEGDSWITCSGGGGNDRPTKFEAGEGGPPMMTTWTKVKPKTEDKPIPGDLAKFQGTWLSPAGANDEVIITFTVKANTYTAHWDSGDGTKVELKGEMKLNEKASPKTVDFVKTERKDGEDARDNLGVYAFDGDTIKVCVGGAGNERPSEFKRGEGGHPLLLIFTKKKN